MSALRLAFMGTPAFAVPALTALHLAGHKIVVVYSQPPKPAGRGQQIHKTPVHQTAEALGIEVRTPKTLRDAGEQNFLADLKLDIAVVAAYGLILPQAILDIPHMGCINIHGSLLPRWRGAAPIQRAILAGDTETGITLMQMEAGLDTGPMLLKKRVPISATTTTSSLHDDLAALGAEMIVEFLAKPDSFKFTPQPDQSVTYAAKLTREDGVIDWRKPAAEIERQVRALTPWPGTFFQFGSEQIKVLQAEIITAPKGAAGTLLDDQFTITCGTGALRLLSVQRPGKPVTGGAALLRGMRLPTGHSFL